MVALKEKDLYEIMNYFAPGILKEIRGANPGLEKGYQTVVKDKADKNYNNFKVFSFVEFSQFLEDSIGKLNEKFQRGKTYRFLFGEPLRRATDYYQNFSKEKITSEVRETTNRIAKSQEFIGIFVLFVTFAGVLAFMSLIFFAISFLIK